MIQRYYKVRKFDDPDALAQLRLIQRFGFPELRELRFEQVLRTEGTDEAGVRKLLPYFCNPVNEQAAVASLLNPDCGPIREVSYRRAMAERQLETIMHCANALGVSELVYARFATRYQFTGVDNRQADEIIARFFCNTTTQQVMAPGTEWDTLIPQGELGDVEHIDIAQMTDEQLLELSKTRKLKMDLAPLQALQHFFKVEEPGVARDGDIHAYAALTSNHCAHTTWEALGLMKRLKRATARINHGRVLSAYVDNAGGFLFYGGQAICIKGETHIHPTFFGDPFCGTMTEFGGLLRDIMGMGQGGRPILTSTILATVDPKLPWEKLPKGFTHPLLVLQGNIRGTHGWNNPSGIPTGWSQYLVHPNNFKGVALGQAMGILPAKRVKKGTPRPGSFIVLAGDDTGNDGVGGATASSTSATFETSLIDAASVQHGEPIMQQALMEVTPILRDHDCIEAVNDCGAAGLTSSCYDLAQKIGCWINLAWVPLKCFAMRKWEILLSESQQRMVYCIRPEKLEEALAIFRTYGVKATVIGVFTHNKRFQAVYDRDVNQATWQTNPQAVMTGEVVANLPCSLFKRVPLPRIEVREPTEKPQPFTPPALSTAQDWANAIRQHLGHYNVADQSAAAQQFDGTVGGECKLHYLGQRNMPDELSARTPVLGKPWTIGAAVSVNQFGSQIDPAAFGRLMVAQAGAKLVAAGFNPANVFLCANVMSPEVRDHPENAWRLVQLVEGYAGATEVTRWPVISGKESGSCTCFGPDGTRYDAPLTLSIYAVSPMPHHHRLITKPFAHPGDHLVLFHPGLEQIHLGGSVYFDSFGQLGNALPILDLKEFRRGMSRYHRLLRQLNWSGNGTAITARSAVSEGGLIRRVFEQALGSGLGCSLQFNFHQSGDELASWLFGELHGSILFTIKPQAFQQATWTQGLQRRDYTVLGQVTQEPNLTVNCGGTNVFSTPINGLTANWSQTFREALAA